VTRDPSDENSNLPPWLRDVPLPPRPRAVDERPVPSAAAPPANPPADEGLPEWLRDTGADAGEPPQASPSWMDSPAQVSPPDQTNQPAALPEWLRETSSSRPASAGSEQLPEWLRDLAGADAPPPEPIPVPAVPATPRPSEEILPDWLRETQGETSPPDDAGQPPSWLADTVEAASAAEPPAPADETPAWLSGIADEPSADQPATVPDWLSSTGDTKTSTPSEAGTPDWLPAEHTPETPATPDWLSGAGDSAPAAPAGTEAIDLWGPDPVTAPPPPPATSSDTTVPDWLRDIAPDDADEQITAEPFSFEGATGTQSPASPSGPPDWLSGGEDTTEAIPDWLRSAVSQSQDLAGAAQETPDVPLWLQDVDSQPADVPAATTPPEPSFAPPSPSTEQPALPPWLSDATTQAPPADVPAWLHEPEPSAPAPADVPAWLHQEPATENGASTQAAASQAEEKAPGFLGANLANTAPEPAPPGPADDLPDWLRPSSPPATPDAGPGQDLPPWLRDEAGQPLPTAGIAGDTNLPAWLRGVSGDPPAAPAPARESPPAPAPANFEWLDQAAQNEARRPSAESEFFGGTELPAWLRPTEPEQPKESNQADARSLDWLTRLGGLDEVESAAPAAVATPRLTPPIARSRTPAQLEALALMERLAATPFPEATPVPAPAQPSVWRRVGIERALYLALLIALLAGLIAPLPESFGLTATPAAPGAPELFGQIDSLSENDVVLVGYEWDARRSGELRPLEDAVLGHLIQRKVKLVLVSTDPQGTLLLFDFRDQLERAGYRKGGEDYILLGYKPGAELALRSFSQNFRAVLMSDFQANDATISALATGSDPSKPRLSSLGDFSMVMVLADEAQDVQGWMEQVQRSARQVPFGFLLPAETTPVAQPYLSQPGIFHLAGNQGALAYQSLRGGSGMPIEQIAREVSQQRMSLLVFVALLLVGAIAVGISAAAARRGRSS